MFCQILHKYRKCMGKSISFSDRGLFWYQRFRKVKIKEMFFFLQTPITDMKACKT